MKPNKRLAALAAVAMAATGVVSIAGATSAQAAFGTTTGTVAYSCNITDNGVATANSNYSPTATVTVAPSSVSVGSTQTITVDVGAGSFNNGPISQVANPPGAYQAIALVSVNDGPLTNIISPTVAAQAASFAQFFPSGWTASWTDTFATGVNDVEIDGFAFNSTTSGPAWAATGNPTDFGNAFSFDTVCSGNTTNPTNNGGAGPPSGSTPPSIPPANALNALNTTFDVVGPNAAVTAVSAQSVTTHVRLGNATTGPPPTFVGAPVQVSVAGTVWDASIASGGFTAAYCDVTGTTCDAVRANTLATDGTGALTGDINSAAGASSVTGNRAIKIIHTASGDEALVPIIVLASPSITVTPSSGGAGTIVAVTGANFNPSQQFGIRGAETNGVPFPTSSDVVANAGTASASGAIASTNFTVNDPDTEAIVVAQGSTPTGPPNATQASATSAFTFSGDACTAYTGNLTGGPGCTLQQNVTATITAGSLSQQAFQTGSNPSATAIDLGSLPTPVATAALNGDLNEIVVTDTRGGTFGWALTATMTDFTATGGSMDNDLLAVDPTCAASAAGSAPGVTAGAAGQDFGGTVALCTKDTQVDPTSGSTSGQYDVNGTLELTVPAFQAAGVYNAIMSITLA